MRGLEVCICGHPRSDHARSSGTGNCLDDECGCLAYKKRPALQSVRGRVRHVVPKSGDRLGCTTVVRVLGRRPDGDERVVEVECVCGARQVLKEGDARRRIECHGGHRRSSGLAYVPIEEAS